MSCLLKASHLSKSFITQGEARTILRDICLEVGPGESVAICGRSGAGKTTLLHILGTLELADEGALTFGDVMVTSSNANILRREKVGFIFQAFHLLENFNVLENISMAAAIARKSFSSSQAEQLLDAVNLTSSAHIPVRLLSGGERQRVAIARALCNNPSLLLADEPTGNLDLGTAKKIGELLLQCVQQYGKSLILATHDQELAALCDRRYYLSEGMLCKLPSLEQDMLV